MDISKGLYSNIKSQARKNAVIQRRLEREIDKNCEQYHSWATKEVEKGNEPVTIIAEGDSWGRYIVGKALVFYIGKILGVNILNLSSPGDEAKDMMATKQRKRLIRELVKGPAPGRKYQFMFFSGGGNDLVGSDRFHKWLHPYQDGMTAEQVLNQQTVDAALLLLKLDYEELIRIRDSESPQTHLLFHSYDFAIPDGRGVCGKGPWLQPGLEMRGVPEYLRHDVVIAFLQRFDGMLNELATQYNNISVIDSQGTLAANEWANELHPKNGGFKKIAQKFVARINDLS